VHSVIPDAQCMELNHPTQARRDGTDSNRISDENAEIRESGEPCG
jgi:hypothetical protein